MKFEQKIKIFKLIVFIITIVIISILLKLSNVSNLTDIVELIEKSNGVGVLIYILLFSILPTFFVSVTILAIGAGLVFGFWYANLWTFIAVFFNATFTYFISKYFAYDLINEYVKEKYGAIYQKIKNRTNGRSGFVLMLILRLLPFIPYTLLNYLSGAVDYDYKIFIIATLLGIIPGMLCYVNIGASLIEGFSEKFIMSIFILFAEKFY